MPQVVSGCVEVLFILLSILGNASVNSDWLTTLITIQALVFSVAEQCLGGMSTEH